MRTSTSVPTNPSLLGCFVCSIILGSFLYMSMSRMHLLIIGGGLDLDLRCAVFILIGTFE